MLHLNEHLKNSPFFLMDLLIPEVYSCPTIKDFNSNNGDIKPTKKDYSFWSIFL